MLVKLDYFKETGKWYGDGEYNTSLENLWDIWDEVREKMRKGELPGLITGHHNEFSVSVDVPEHEHNHPRLIHPWRT